MKIGVRIVCNCSKGWIPAFAEMTNEKYRSLNPTFALCDTFNSKFYNFKVRKSGYVL